MYQIVDNGVIAMCWGSYDKEMISHLRKAIKPAFSYFNVPIMFNYLRIVEVLLKYKSKDDKIYHCKVGNRLRKRLILDR